MLTPLAIIGILCMLLLSFFFSGTETAMTSANRANLQQAKDNGDRGAGMAIACLERPDIFLSTTLVGNNLVNVVAATLADMLTAAHIPDGWEILVNVLTVTPLLLIFGEILPKTLGRAHADAWSARAAGLVCFCEIVLKPLVLLVSWIARRITMLVSSGPAPAAEITREDMQALAEIAVEEGVLGAASGRILQNLFRLNSQLLKDTMVPLDKVEMLPLDATAGAAEALSIRSGFTRFPVHDGARTNIVGVLDLRNLLYGKTAAGHTGAPAMPEDAIAPFVRRDIARIPGSRPVSDMLHEMRRHPVPMAVVLDQNGSRVAGIVTAEDLTEELVGECRPATA